MRVILNNLPKEYQPHSSSAKFSDLWQQDLATPRLMATVYDRWRARSLHPNGKPSEPVTGMPPTIKDTRAVLRQQRATGAPTRAPQAQPQPASSVSAQVRQRLQAQGAPAKPQSLSDVKAMLNSAFHRDI